ncbi:MAG: polyprenyl synthetase family protein [Deinococcota bacterium]
MFDLIQNDLQTFEARLASELQSSVAFIDAIGEELVSAGGKRLRPSLALLAGQLLCAHQQKSMTVALAVELLHSASLLHDDLIDDADTRRGREAAFKRYGNVVSVMSGDFMLAKVLGLLAVAGSADFTRLMSQTAADICEAEVLQFQMAALETYSFEDYRTIIQGKTAVLIAAALEGVAMLHGVDTQTQANLRNFGLAYGRAFQMQDDYLDLMGEEETLGKPIGGDLHEGKATYPVLLVIEQSPEALAILRRHAKEANDVLKMRELVTKHGADVATKAKIIEEAESSLKYLKSFADSEAKTVLASLPERELERAR